MAQYMLLLQDDPREFADLSPDQIQAVVQEYSAWRQKLVDESRLVAAEKLKDEGGREMSTVDGTVQVVDGPYSEATEVLGGFFMVEAASYDEAVELARSCPHLVYGKRIQIREVDPVHD